MRQPISWSDLRGRRVALWGLGVEGAANLRRLRSLGVDPVLVDRVGRSTEDGHPVLGTADSPRGIDALRSAEVVVKSPGISRYDEVVVDLRRRGLPVVGGMGLWLAEVDPERVVCVTGTKGKSTTTAIAGALITGLGHRCLVGGNIGVPPWDPDVDGVQPDWWVVEVSSFQALDIEAGPAVVAVTSLGEDHFDWHRSRANYHRDKLSLCTKLRVRSVVADGHDSELRSNAGLLGSHVSWVTAHHEPWMDGLHLLGAHNVRNAAIALQAVRALRVPRAEDPHAITEAARIYQPLPSRLMLVKRSGQVDFIDDSLSTNVGPAIAAVDAFRGRKIALLVGGFDRGIDYAPLGRELSRTNSDITVFTLPDNGPRIGQAIAAFPGAPPVRNCDDLASATTQAFAWAQPDGVVLLSPAAPSFGRFADYRARAAEFKAIACSLGDGV